MFLQGVKHQFQFAHKKYLAVIDIITNYEDAGLIRCGSGHRGPASEAESCRRSRALEAFGFLMLKYEFPYILETLFLSFLTSTSTLKAKTSTFNLH